VRSETLLLDRATTIPIVKRPAQEWEESMPRDEVPKKIHHDLPKSVSVKDRIAAYVKVATSVFSGKKEQQPPPSPLQSTAAHMPAIREEDEGI